MRGHSSKSRRSPRQATHDGGDAICPASPPGDSLCRSFTYEDQLARNTGCQTPTQSWEAAQSRSDELRAQTESIATDLETQGVAARRTESNTTLIGDVTGAGVTETEYRAIRFLPLIAQRHPPPMLHR